MKYYTMSSSIGQIVIEAKNNNQANSVLRKVVDITGCRTGASGICSQDEISVTRIITNYVLYGSALYFRYSEVRKTFKLETFDEFKLPRYFQEAVRTLNYRS